MAHTEYPGCQRLFTRGFRFPLVSSAFGRTRVGPRPTELLVAREKKHQVRGVIRGGSARKGYLFQAFGIGKGSDVTC